MSNMGEGSGLAQMELPEADLRARPSSIEDLGEAVRAAPGRVLPCGGGTKAALSTAPASRSAAQGPDLPLTIIETTALTGITEYNPNEFTFTARAGTPLATIAAALGEHGQAMPFDPPFVEAGATLGGAIATGVSGPGRVRYGGLRDFLLGVHLVDGMGRQVRGGGRVVKNAAGLDIARLMVGSIGRLGILAEATFKVFPAPPAYGTVRLPCGAVPDAMQLLLRLGSAQIDFEGLEVVPDEAAIYVRLGGLAHVLPQRLAQLRAPFGGVILPAEDEPDFWRAARELTWAPTDYSLARVALDPNKMVELDKGLGAFAALRRYSAGGHAGWVAWDSRNDVEAIDGLLIGLGLSALVLRGATPRPILGARTGQALLAKVRPVFDPNNRFLDL